MTMRPIAPLGLLQDEGICLGQELTGPLTRMRRLGHFACQVVRRASRAGYTVRRACGYWTMALKSGARVCSWRMDAQA